MKAAKTRLIFEFSFPLCSLLAAKNASSHCQRSAGQQGRSKRHRLSSTNFQLRQKEAKLAWGRRQLAKTRRILFYLPPPSSFPPPVTPDWKSSKLGKKASPRTYPIPGVIRAEEREGGMVTERTFVRLFSQCSRHVSPSQQER